MGRRNVEHVCAECGKKINGTPTECMGCLRLFHSSCLQRVKLKNKRPSYMMCEDCVLEKHTERVLVGPTRIDEDALEASPHLSSNSRGS